MGLRRGGRKEKVAVWEEGAEGERRDEGSVVSLQLEERGVTSKEESGEEVEP